MSTYPQIAFAVQGGKGTMALLLGSGISRSAEIPTGWEVTLDLIRRVAATLRENPDPNAAAWYEQKFREAPNYSNLLAKLAQSGSSRQTILRGYFEPTEEERLEGVKLPTAAHHAIARLVAGGFIRVLVTTNFDHLLETALRDAGVEPTIVSTADAATGAVPLAHQRCILIKANGDYTDQRFRNTPEELTAYEEPLKALLIQVFEEYGLIVCGWSADYDTGLVNILSARTRRMYGSFWTVKDPLTETAQRLVTLQGFETVKVEGADAFFSDLEDQVKALEEFGKRPPMTRRLAVASAKRLLEENNVPIRLQDILVSEAQRVREYVTGSDYQRTGPLDRAEAARLTTQLEAATETLVAVGATCATWNRGRLNEALAKALRVLANPGGDEQGNVARLNLRRFPAMLFLYATGTAAVAVKDYALLKALFDVPVDKHRGQLPCVLALAPPLMFPDGLDIALSPEGRSFYAPSGEFMHRHVRAMMLEHFSTPADFDHAYFEFETLFAIQYGVTRETGSIPFWAFGGNWVFARDPDGRPVVDALIEAAKAQNTSWPPSRAALFNGSATTFVQAAEKAKEGHRGQAPEFTLFH